MEVLLPWWERRAPRSLDHRPPECITVEHGGRVAPAPASVIDHERDRQGDELTPPRERGYVSAITRADVLCGLDAARAIRAGMLL